MRSRTHEPGRQNILISWSHEVTEVLFLLELATRSNEEMMRRRINEFICCVMWKQQEATRKSNES